MKFSVVNDKAIYSQQLLLKTSSSQRDADLIRQTRECPTALVRIVLWNETNIMLVGCYWNTFSAPQKIPWYVQTFSGWIPYKTGRTIALRTIIDDSAQRCSSAPNWVSAWITTLVVGVTIHQLGTVFMTIALSARFSFTRLFGKLLEFWDKETNKNHETFKIFHTLDLRTFIIGSDRRCSSGCQGIFHIPNKIIITSCTNVFAFWIFNFL